MVSASLLVAPAALTGAGLLSVAVFTAQRSSRVRNLSAGAEYAGTAWLYGHEVQASAIVTESSISITSVGLVPFTCDDMPFKPVAPEVEIEDETVNDLELLSTCLADALAQYGHDHAAGSDTDTDAAGPAPLMKLASLQLVPDRSIKLSFSYRDALPVSVYLERMHAGQELARQAEREGEYMNEAEVVAPCLQKCLKDEHDVASRRSSLYLASCRKACTTPAALEAARAEAQRSRALLAPALSISSLFDAADRLTASMVSSERHKLTDSAGLGLDVAPSGTYEGDMKLFGIKVDAIMRFDDADPSYLDFKISGTIALECDHEAFTFASGTISITGVNTAGDCVHDALSSNGVGLSGVTYDAKTDQVTITVTYNGLPVPLSLKKTASTSPGFSDAVVMEALYSGLER